MDCGKIFIKREWTSLESLDFQQCVCWQINIACVCWWTVYHKLHTVCTKICPKAIYSFNLFEKFFFTTLNNIARKEWTVPRVSNLPSVNIQGCKKEHKASNDKNYEDDAIKFIDMCALHNDDDDDAVDYENMMAMLKSWWICEYVFILPMMIILINIIIMMMTMPKSWWICVHIAAVQWESEQSMKRDCASGHTYDDIWPWWWWWKWWHTSMMMMLMTYDSDNDNDIWASSQWWRLWSSIW